MVGVVISFLSFLGRAALKNLEAHLIDKGIDKENTNKENTEWVG